MRIHEFPKQEQRLDTMCHYNFVVLVIFWVKSFQDFQVNWYFLLRIWSGLFQVISGVSLIWSHYFRYLRMVLRQRMVIFLEIYKHHII